MILTDGVDVKTREVHIFVLTLEFVLIVGKCFLRQACNDVTFSN